VAWLSTHALGSVILVMIWQWTPFMMLIVLAGLQSQPSDTLEAAKVDGAGAFATFRELTFPHLRPTSSWASCSARSTWSTRSTR
jgi:ABC-type sugar transport systems, permease components